MMCGIAGIVSPGNALNNLSKTINIVNKMADVQTHRGPDDFGVWYDNHCVLSHRRLSILDLTSAGRQPMISDDASNIVVTFNGEIYNYLELKSILRGYGHHFNSETDTEVLLRSYQQWGIDFIGRLSGMFAFAIWDSKERRLILARDRVGKKPLFYSLLDGVITFSSEIQAILKNPLIDRQLNWQGIDQYLSYGYIPSPNTGLASIRKMLPGQIAIYEPDQPLKLVKYWVLSFIPKNQLTEVDAIRAVRDKLSTAVRRRMISDVPVGAFLSGGLDSSIIVGLMAQHSNRTIKTYSIGFKDLEYNELDYARQVSDKWSTDHHEFIFEPAMFRTMPDLIGQIGEPFADISILPTAFLAQMTSKEVKVVLTGDGGDESFAGYERYLANHIAEKIYLLPGGSFLLKQCVNILNRLALQETSENIKHLRRIRFLEMISLPMAKRYPGWLTYFTNDQKKNLYIDESLYTNNDYLGDLTKLNSRLEPLDVGMAVDISSYLSEDLLVKLDVSTMAYGLEARSPFLDHQVMEFAATLPTKIKLKGIQTKYLLKKAFADLLPKDVLHRPKMGFGVPVGKWFRGPLRDLLYGSLLDIESPIIKRQIVEKYISNHMNESHNYSFQLWNLLVLNLWLDSIKQCRTNDV